MFEDIGHGGLTALKPELFAEELLRAISMDKIHIEKGSVQETLIIPLYARKLCAEQFPVL